MVFSDLGPILSVHFFFFIFMQFPGKLAKIIGFPPPPSGKSCVCILRHRRLFVNDVIIVDMVMVMLSSDTPKYLRKICFE